MYGLSSISRGARAFLLGTAVMLGLAATSAAQTPPATKSAVVFNILEHGAVADGATLNTEAIQRAIDACHAQGGGVVLVPAGRFATATILLKDNITLRLEENAVLFGSPELLDYRNVDAFYDGVGVERGFALVAAVDAKNIVIEGRGQLDGNGAILAAQERTKQEFRGRRPLLLRLVRCQDVQLRDFSLRDSAAWTLNLFQCKNVQIDRLTINSRVASNNDGIDIDSCQNIRIAGCDIDTGDDSICFKTTSAQACRDVTITGCRLKSRHGAIKFGTESVGDFENITIAGCAIRETRGGGIKILSVDGSNIRNIAISDITMDDVVTPIFVRLGARLKTYRPGETPRPVGSIENVVIRNVRATSSTQGPPMPPSGIFITGIPGHRVGKMTLENISITLPGGGTRDHGRASLAENITNYPELNRFGPTLPAYGLYARHAQDLTVNNLKLELTAPDLRPVIVCQDGERLLFDGVTATADPGTESAVRFEAVRDGKLNAVQIAGHAGPLLLEEPSYEAPATTPTLPAASAPAAAH
jgi:hypothetical protein